MIKPTNWSGNYSRFPFDESKNYQFMFKIQGVEVLDDDFNQIQESIRTTIRRMTSDSIGNAAVGNSFRCVGSGASNNFTITGGDGTVDGAAHLYISGWLAILLGSTTYSTQPITQPLLTTPSVNRTDEIYLDVFIDEVGPLVDPVIRDPVLNKETSRRGQLKWAVKVVEGGVTPANFSDANGAPHYTYRLATMARTPTAVISAGIVTDRRAMITPLAQADARYGYNQASTVVVSNLLLPTPVTTSNATTFDLQTVDFVFPPYSRTGAFKLFIESQFLLVGAAAGSQNFTTLVLDPTNANVNVMPPSLFKTIMNAASESAGHPLQGMSPFRYTPGTTVSFKQQVAQGSGGYSGQVTNCFLRLTALEG